MDAIEGYCRVRCAIYPCLGGSNGCTTGRNLDFLFFGDDLCYGVMRTPCGNFHLFVVQHRTDDKDLSSFADQLAQARLGAKHLNRPPDDGEFVTEACVFLRRYDTTHLRFGPAAK